MTERVPHVYRRIADGWHTWMCPSRKKGWVWVLGMSSTPTSWGDSTVTTSFTLMPVEDWNAQGWEIDEREESRILTSGLLSWMSGWHKVESWP